MTLTITKPEILFGDSFSILPTLPKKFFQLVLADPPYEISQENNFTTMGRRGLDFGQWDKDFDQFSWIESVIPAMKPGGSIVIWNDWKKISMLAVFMEKLGLKVRRQLVWHKSNPAPFNCKNTFLQSTEFAVWATKKGKTVYNSNYHHGVFDYAVQRSDHPTKKADGLFKEIIEILSNVDDWVLDPFLGSGTTAIMSKKINRNFIGIEKDPEYYKLAVRNLGNV